MQVPVKPHLEGMVTDDKDRASLAIDWHIPRQPLLGLWLKHEKPLLQGVTVDGAIGKAARQGLVVGLGNCHPIKGVVNPDLILKHFNHVGFFNSTYL